MSGSDAGTPKAGPMIVPDARPPGDRPLPSYYEASSVRDAIEQLRTTLKSEAGHIAYVDDEINAIVNACRIESEAALAAVRAERDALQEQLHRSVPMAIHEAVCTDCNHLKALLLSAEAACETLRQQLAQVQQARDTAQAMLRGLPPTFAAGLLTALKEECEAQHARANAAEAKLAALHAQLEPGQDEWLSNYEAHLTAIADAFGLQLNGSECQWSDMTREALAEISKLQSVAALHAARPQEKFESRSSDGDGHAGISSGRQHFDVSRSAKADNSGAEEASTTDRAGSEPADSLSRPTGGLPAAREGLNALLINRGTPILEAVRARDRDLAYQVGMLLGDIARMFNVNDPSLPPVPLPAPRPPAQAPQ